MKIIINQPRASYFVGGAEMISFEHAKHFYLLKNEVYFFTLNPKSVGLNYSKQYKKFYKEYNNKIKFIELKQEKKIKYIYKIKPGEDRCRWNIESINYNSKLYEYINNNDRKYDFAFSYYNLDLVFYPHEKIKKNVLYLCGIPKEQNDFQGSFLSSYSNIIAISKEVKESWKKYSKNEINVITTGVDFNRFSSKRRKKNDKIRLLYVGRLISRKNVDLIINAFEKMKKNYNVELTIVGDGPEIDKLKKLSKDCIFAGVVSNTEKYYKNADIFITPSQYGEGLQGTILEAMSCGLKIVATNTEINKELLLNRDGVLIETNVKSLIDGIKKVILANDQIYSDKNREYVQKNFNWNSKAKEIIEVIK